MRKELQSRGTQLSQASRGLATFISAPLLTPLSALETPPWKADPGCEGQEGLPLTPSPHAAVGGRSHPSLVGMLCPGKGSAAPSRPPRAFSAMGTGSRACKERVRWSGARTVFFSLNLNNCPLPPAELQTNVLLRKKPSFTYLFVALSKHTWCFAALAFCPPDLRI